MGKRILLLILCFISVETFGQWKSFYPEESQKKVKNKSSKKDDRLFTENLFTVNIINLNS